MYISKYCSLQNTKNEKNHKRNFNILVKFNTFMFFVFFSKITLTINSSLCDTVTKNDDKKSVDKTVNNANIHLEIRPHTYNTRFQDNKLKLTKRYTFLRIISRYEKKNCKKGCIRQEKDKKNSLSPNKSKIKSNNAKVYINKKTHKNVSEGKVKAEDEYERKSNGEAELEAELKGGAEGEGIGFRSSTNQHKDKTALISKHIDTYIIKERFLYLKSESQTDKSPVEEVEIQKNDCDNEKINIEIPKDSLGIYDFINDTYSYEMNLSIDSDCVLSDPPIEELTTGNVFETEEKPDDSRGLYDLQKHSINCTYGDVNCTICDNNKDDIFLSKLYINNKLYRLETTYVKRDILLTSSINNKQTNLNYSYQNLIQIAEKKLFKLSKIVKHILNVFVKVKLMNRNKYHINQYNNDRRNTLNILKTYGILFRKIREINTAFIGMQEDENISLKQDIIRNCYEIYDNIIKFEMEVLKYSKKNKKAHSKL